ncbi:MAG TPA: hypothetical protein VMB21_10220 [Candidatus Limnocylindria bacterium]|jgi:hypothetical protein|nr:hypothetical protein [Candidatus Limnocylindria bacterium]
MDILVTKNGLRLSQHGVVISELRTTPGPTDSIFDVLSALISVLRPAGRLGVLGFAGGGMMAPLRQLGVATAVHSVDLDRPAYELFCQHCPGWRDQVEWHEADAVAWLRSQRSKFDLLMDDLSVPYEGDVIKPVVSWRILPGLIRRRLRPGGIAVFNLLKPAGGNWNPELCQIADEFGTAHLIHPEEFENRILVAGDTLPSARVLGATLRQALRALRSRQAGRIRVRQLRPEPA